MKRNFINKRVASIFDFIPPQISFLSYVATPVGAGELQGQEHDDFVHVPEYRPILSWPVTIAVQPSTRIFLPDELCSDRYR